MALVDPADLPAPYSADPNAAEKILAATSQVRSAVDSSPRRYQLPANLEELEAGTSGEQEVAAELKQLVIALALDLLTQGKAGAGQKVLRDAAVARARLSVIRQGASLALTARSGRPLQVLGDRPTSMQDMFTAFPGPRR